MNLKVVLMFTMLSIIGEYKGTQGANSILNHFMEFNTDAFDEFNLVCYVSMYAVIEQITSYMKIAQDQLMTQDLYNYLLNINVINTKLQRLSGWNKFFNLSSKANILNNFASVKEWIANPFNVELIEDDAESTVTFSKFNFTQESEFKTPKGRKFFQTLYSKNQSQIIPMVSSTFFYCSSTLIALSQPTESFEESLVNEVKKYEDTFLTHSLITYGYILLLMTEENFIFYNNLLPISEVTFEDNGNKFMFTQETILVAIIEEVVQEIYRGMLNIMRKTDISRYRVPELKNNRDVDVELMRMLMFLYYNVVDLSGVLNSTLIINSVAEELTLIKELNIGSVIDYCYSDFVNDFKLLWANKLEKIEIRELNEIEFTYRRRGNRVQNERISAQIGKSIEQGRLLQNNIVAPSIIGYYAVYEEKWEDTNAIFYAQNMDHRIIFLMELKAWSTILYQKAIELRDSIATAKGHRQALFRPQRYDNDLFFLRRFETIFYDTS